MTTHRPQIALLLSIRNFRLVRSPVAEHERFIGYELGPCGVLFGPRNKRGGILWQQE